jgi:hypothetical protein
MKTIRYSNLLAGGIRFLKYVFSRPKFLMPWQTGDGYTVAVPGCKLLGLAVFENRAHTASKQ